jgi:hypothetical protein
VSVFAYFASCPGSGILNMSAIFGAAAAGFGAAFARGFARLRAGLRIAAGVARADLDDRAAMVDAPGLDVTALAGRRPVRNEGSDYSTPSVLRRQYGGA